MIAVKGAIHMESGQHLIVVARTRLIPIEIFTRGRWVVVEMTDDRNAVERKFQALQRLSQLYKGGKPAVEAVVFASEKADIGMVSVVGLYNVTAPPKLTDVFATEKWVRHSFWQKVFERLRETFDPPVAHYDAIEAERLFASEAAKQADTPHLPYWMRVEILGPAVAALLVVGFTGAWFIENMTSNRAALSAQEQTVAEQTVAEEDEPPPPPPVTKSDRLSGLASYFSSGDE